MQKFSFEFKTTSGGSPSSHHYSIFGTTEADARDNLVAQLEEVVKAAQALDVRTTPPAAAPSQDEAPAADDKVAARKARAAAAAKARRAAKKAAAPAKKVAKGKAGK